MGVSVCLCAIVGGRCLYFSVCFLNIELCIFVGILRYFGACKLFLKFSSDNHCFSPSSFEKATNNIVVLLVSPLSVALPTVCLDSRSSYTRFWP